MSNRSTIQFAGIPRQNARLAWPQIAAELPLSRGRERAEPKHQVESSSRVCSINRGAKKVSLYA
jgi:hypothetical protein